MADWEVIYRATADFADLTRKAREAKTTLRELQAAAKQEADEEVKGATAAAAAHDRDAAAIDRQKRAMEQALVVAKAYNQFVNQGGRTSADQHLSDLKRETDQTGLLNRARQRGFVSPQSDFAFRQQEINQRRLLNTAEWGGYQSKDQYLNSLQREKAAFEGINSAWARRVELIRQNTQASVQHTNVIQGTTKSAGQLASQGTSITDASVKGAQEQLKKTLDDLAHARMQGGTGDSGAVVGQFRAIAAAIKDIEAKTRGLDLEPEGLSKLKTAFTDAQAQAARVFPDIEARGRQSADGVKGAWQRTSNAFHDVFSSMRVSAEDAASGVEGDFHKAAAGIRGAFSSLGGSGGGLGGAFAGLANLGGELSGSVLGSINLLAAGILALIQVLPALAAGLGAVSSIAATLPDFLGAAAGAFVTFQSAIMPVVEALQKYGQLLTAQEAVDSGDLQSKMQQQAAYHSLADAQFSLSQAVVQGSNQQVVAAHAVADAQYTLRQAYFQAGITQIQTSMQLASAQHSLQDANFSVTQSQYQLTIAWQQARFQLQQLQLTVSGASLNLRGAQLQLEQAQQNYATVMAQSTSTALDRAEAAYQIQVAEQNLKQVTLSNSQNEQQLANVRKYGMQQVFGVTAAQHALADAQFSQVQAQKQLIITEKEAANAQIQSAHAIMDAIFGVQQARFQEAQGAVTSSHQITDAQFSVQQSQEQLRLDAQAGGAAAASAYEAFQVALDQLSPAARKAVKDLEPLFVWWQTNTKAQQAFFGRFNDNLANISKAGVGLIGPLNRMLDHIARALGTVASSFLTWFEHLANSPIWKVFTNTSVKIISDLGAAALLFAKGLAQIARAAAPLAGQLSGMVLQWAREFRNWAVQEMKPGSMLHVLMREAPSALQALYEVLKSLLDVVLILAGGTPKFNNKGVLTGVIPSDSQNSAFRTFLTLMAALANQILPILAQVLARLASPQMANALITLLTALSQLLLQVVTSPGFMTAFILFVDSFSTLVNLFGWLVQNTPLGSLLGVIAAAFVAMSVLKFTGVLALLNNLKNVASWLSGIKNADGFFGKLGAIFGAGGNNTIGVDSAGMQGAADTMASAATAMQTAADTMTGAAGKQQVAADTEVTAAETGGAAGAGGFLRGGGFIAGAGRAVGGLAILDLLARAGFAAIPQQPKADLKAVGTGGTAGNIDRAIFGGGVNNFVAWWTKNVKNPVDSFFKTEIPKLLSDQAFRKYWQTVNAWWMQYVQNPTGHFFSQLIPDWLGGAGQGWKGLWSNAQNVFTNDIWDPLSNFFTGTIPHWFDKITGWWESLWSNAWGTFQKKLIDPVGNWFSHTLPSAVETGFQGALKWVVGKLNTVIGWINDATKLVGLPAIKPISATGLAGGGQMPHRGGGPRQDNRLARLSDGEFVVNAEATRRHRGLLEAINARGLAGGGFFSGLWSDITHGAGDVWGAVTSLFSGAGSALGRLKNLVLRDGAKPVVDAMWGHLVTPLLGAMGVNSQTEKNILPHIIGYLAGDLHKGLDKVLSSAPGGGMPIHVTGGTAGNVASWSPEVRSVLAQTGEPASDLGAVLHRIAQESGGQPSIVNKWDSNWLAGHPSVGLMQVIQGTFDAYAGPYRNVGPFEYGVSVDPIANIYAGVNYAKHAYTEPLYDVMMQPGGYGGGGPVGMPALAFAGLPQLSLSSPRIPGFGVAGAGGGAGRVQSDAARAGQGGNAPFIENMTINNPVAERAGDSITRSVMKASFLAGRGVA